MKRLQTYVERPNSVLTGNGPLEPLHSFRNFPVFFGAVDSPPEEDVVADMEWGMDMTTGMIQLTKLVPLDILYQSQHVDGCGPTWQAYYAEFADYVASFSPKVVVEIGGGMGVLAKSVTRMIPELEWHVVEPNPAFEPTSRIHVQREFFDRNTIMPAQADMIVFSQVLEHAYDPKEFMAMIAHVLRPGGRLVFAYPHLLKWLQEKYTNALNFEHTMLLTDAYIDPLLLALGFKVLDKKVYKDHSFFYAAERLSLEPALQDVVWPDLAHEHRAVFMDFIRYHKDMVLELNKELADVRRPTYLFGAHIFSTYLFSFGLDATRIAGILDNSPTKRGRRFYGSSFLVDSPIILKDKGLVRVILKAGIYTEEIKKDILTNINPEVRFL